MKLHFRDKLAALAGAVVLAVLVLVSYYYALMGQIGNLKTKARSPNLTATARPSGASTPNMPSTFLTAA